MKAPLLSSSELLRELNEGREPNRCISRSLLHQWVTTKPAWRACVIEHSARKTWYSRQRLIDAGILMREPVPKVVAGPGFSFSYDTKAIANG